MTYTAETLMTRWEQLRAIKNLMGRMSADYVLKKESSMVDSYWSNREDITLGINTGWFIGREEVARYYREISDRIKAESVLISSIFPKELSEKDEQSLHGVGTMDYKPIDTPVVEIAGDGLTAKGIWSVRGSHARITPSGPVAYWEWGWFLADFILEEGQFRLWHLQYLIEAEKPCGHSWTSPEYSYPLRPEFSEVSGFSDPKPTVEEVLREKYRDDRPFTALPRIPEPYDTFGDTFTYGWKEA